MAGFRGLGDGPRRSSAAAAAASSFVMVGGKGLYAGDVLSGVARALLQAGMIRIANGDCIGANPVIYSLNAPVEIARATIDYTLNTPQLIEFEGEMMDVEITEVVFRDYNAVPSVNLRGGLYASPPQNNVLQPAAMIVPETTAIATGVTAAATLEMDAFKFAPATKIRRLSDLYYIPNVVNPSALKGVISVRGVPTWQKTWAT